jgi:hypothetical protein
MSSMSSISVLSPGGSRSKAVQSSCLVMSSSITTASHSNIHTPAALPLCSCALCFPRLHPAANLQVTSSPPLSHSIPPATPPSSYPPLSTYSSHVPTDWERPCELTDSPTPSTFYPRPLSRTRTLSNSKSHAANRRRHRQSDIANPARTLLSQHRSFPLLTYR